MMPIVRSFLETGATQQASTSSMLMSFLSMILIIVALYFIMLRPQKKKEKAVQEMRNNLQVGDEIVTIGGVVGIVVSVKDDTVVIETGSDRSKIRFQRWAIQQNNTEHTQEVAE